MKIEYILSFWLMLFAILLSIFGSERLFNNTGQSIKILFNNGTLQIYYNEEIVIYSLTVFPDNQVYNTTNIRLDSCPTAVILHTNKGYYKVFDLKC